MKKFSDINTNTNVNENIVDSDFNNFSDYKNALTVLNQFYLRPKLKEIVNNSSSSFDTFGYDGRIINNKVYIGYNFNFSPRRSSEIEPCVVELWLNIKKCLDDFKMLKIITTNSTNHYSALIDFESMINDKKIWDIIYKGVENHEFFNSVEFPEWYKKTKPNIFKSRKGVKGFNL